MSLLPHASFERALLGRVVPVTGGAGGIGLACAEFCGRVRRLLESGPSLSAESLIPPE